MHSATRAGLFAIVLSLAVITVGARGTLGSMAAMPGVETCVDPLLVASHNSLEKALVQLEASVNPQPSAEYTARVRQARQQMAQGFRNLKAAIQVAENCRDG